MALPSDYGPNPNDSGDDRLSKIHILIWHWLRGLVPQGGDTPAATPIPVTQPNLTPGTPALVTADGTAIAANPLRKAFIIQNLDDAAVYVRMGGTASTSVFDFVLPACLASNDGTSPAVMIYGVTSIVTILAATGAPRVTKNEYT